MNKPQVTGKKRCSRCKAVKAVPRDFYMRGTIPYSQCKECHRKKIAERYVRIKTGAHVVTPKPKPLPPAPVPVVNPLDDEYFVDPVRPGRRNNAVLRAEIAELLARKGLRRPAYVARRLGISVELAAQLMSDV